MANETRVAINVNGHEFTIGRDERHVWVKDAFQETWTLMPRRATAFDVSLRENEIALYSQDDPSWTPITRGQEIAEVHENVRGNSLDHGVFDTIESAASFAANTMHTSQALVGPADRLSALEPWRPAPAEDIHQLADALAQAMRNVLSLQ